MKQRLSDGSVTPGEARPAFSRWSLGLVLLPIPALLAASISGIEGDTSWHEMLVKSGWCLLSAEITSCVGGILVLAISIAGHRKIKAASCLWLGAVVGALTLFGGRILRFVITGDLGETGTADDGANWVFISFALSSFGWLGGAVLWHLNKPRQETNSREQTKYSRLWRHFRLWRLAAGGIAYMIPFAILPAMYVTNEGDPDAVLGPLGLALLGLWFAAIWPSIGGAALFAILLRSRPSGIIRRLDCVTLGFVVSLLGLPIAAMPFFFLNVISYHLNDAIKTVSTSLIYGGAVAPFGLLSGWLFWRIAVYPLPAESQEWSTFE